MEQACVEPTHKLLLSLVMKSMPSYPRWWTYGHPDHQTHILSTKKKKKKKKKNQKAHFLGDRFQQLFSVRCVGMKTIVLSVL